MTYEVRTQQLIVVARGTGYGGVAGAAMALLPGILISGWAMEYFFWFLLLAEAVGMVTGATAGLVGGLALARFCVPGPVTVGRARWVATVAEVLLSLAVVLTIGICMAVRHQRVPLLGFVAGSLVAAVITSCIACVLANRVVYGKGYGPSAGDRATVPAWQDGARSVKD